MVWGLEQMRNRGSIRTVERQIVECLAMGILSRPGLQQRIGDGSDEDLLRWVLAARRRVKAILRDERREGE